ncbi:MAG: hypothetical protein AVDCRST_MAG38-247, partial [uncultured Solirubrobacteraceae bacterium]
WPPILRCAPNAVSRPVRRCLRTTTTGNAATTRVPARGCPSKRPPPA